MSNQSTDSGRSSSGFRDSETISMTDASIQLPESYAVSNQTADILESSLMTTQISEQPSSKKEDSDKPFFLEEENNDESLHKDDKVSLFYFDISNLTSDSYRTSKCHSL